MNSIKNWQSKRNVFSYLGLFLLFCAIPLCLYAVYYKNGFAIVSGDGVAYFSMRKVLSENLLNYHEFSLWEKNLAAGIPYLSIGDFSPIGFLFSFLPMKEFVYVYYTFHLAIGAFFMYLYLKQIGCNYKVALVVALIYETSIHLGGLRKNHMVIIAVVVFLPAILYFIEKYLATNKMQWLLITSIVMSLQFYSGHIQYVLYTDIFVFFYLIVHALHKKFSMKRILCQTTIWISVYLGLIMMQLLPVAEVMFEYGKTGASENSFQNFCSWSIHFFKLLMMVFPTVFNEVYMPFGNMYSSELDIELFLGVITFIILFWQIYSGRKDFFTKFFFIVMCVTFCYAAIGHIPILNKIIYHFPILSGFRCPARALFLFIFSAFTLFAIGLTRLHSDLEQKEFYKFLLKIGQYGIGIVIACGITIIIFSFANSYSNEQLIQFMNYVIKTFIPVILVFIVLLALFQSLHSEKIKDKLNKEIFYTSFLIFCVLITWLEVGSYTLQTITVDVDEFFAKDVVSEQIKSDVLDKKIWDAFAGIDGAHESIISQNKSIVKNIPSINAYVAYNNPRLYKLFTPAGNAPLNFSGLLTGSVDVSQNLILQNDLLSMLGVKYIIDSSENIEKQNNTIRFTNENIIFQQEKVKILGNNEQISVIAIPLEIKSNRFYRVAYLSDNSTSLETFYIDFYGGENYDLAESQKNLSADGKQHEVILYSDDTSKATEPIVMRFIAETDNDIDISNVVVTELEGQETNNFYKPYLQQENGIWIYENPNVCDILYTPEKIVPIDSMEQLYSNPYGRQFDKVNYLEEDIGLTYLTGKTEISNIDFTSNQITADVESEQETFVNFSQCYYPGWKAYINGKKTEIYLVNGVIQGIKVPAGKSEIQFKYDPWSFKLGCGITVITLCFVIFYCIRMKRKYAR